MDLSLDWDHLRVFLAVAIQHLDPHRARALVLRALDDHRALGPEPTDDRRALEAWLTWHDARNPPVRISPISNE